MLSKRTKGNSLMETNFCSKMCSWIKKDYFCYCLVRQVNFEFEYKRC